MKVFTKAYAFAAAVVALALCGGCGLVYDDNECPPVPAQLEFHYDRNLKFADAFSHEVSVVNVLVFDQSGTLVCARKTSRNALDGGNTITLPITAGEYDILTWGGDTESDFKIPSPIVGKSKLTEFKCILNSSSTRLGDLYHSLDHVNFGPTRSGNQNKHYVDLTKDTNHIRVMLQQQGNAGSIGAGDFSFEITDNNGVLDYDNTILRRETESQVTYTPWAVTEGSASYSTSERPDGETSSENDMNPEGNINMVMAEFSVSRLTPSNPAILTVRRKEDGKTVLKFPLVDYALMLRGEYLGDMDAGEFLDRQDDYSMTFVLDGSQRWISVVIQINDWRIIRHNDILE